MAKTAEALAAEARAAVRFAPLAKKLADEAANEATAARECEAAQKKVEELKAAELKAQQVREAAEKTIADARTDEERQAAARLDVDQLKADEATAKQEREAAEQTLEGRQTAVETAKQARQVAELHVGDVRGTATAPTGFFARAASAVYEIGWGPLFVRTVSLIIIAALTWFGWKLLSRADINVGVSDVGFTRGLITLMLLLFIIAMGITLILYVINEVQDARIKLRVDSARDILAPLLGIFGTVIGFYFGSVDKLTATPVDTATVQALGGVLVGDTAVFREGTVEDGDLAKLVSIHPLRRLYLDRTNVSNAGVLAHLVKLDDLRYLSLRQTKVSPATADALKKAFKDRKQDLTIDGPTPVESTPAPVDQAKAAGL
jgi:hypothetical protein